MSIAARPMALRLLTVFGALVIFSLEARAQNFVVWTTNFYSVTGASFREIRRSIAASRPFQDGFDGDTRWNVDWKFTLADTGNGCSCTSFSTTTKIVTTLPRWTPPTNVFPEVKEQWTRYFTNLAQHEAGHARIGIAAATEVGRSISQSGAHPACEQLKRTINERAARIVDDYRAREKEYDRRTAHGNKSPDSP